MQTLSTFSLVPRPSTRGEGLEHNPGWKCPDGMLWVRNNDAYVVSHAHPVPRPAGHKLSIVRASVQSNTVHWLPNKIVDEARVCLAVPPSKQSGERHGSRSMALSSHNLSGTVEP